MATTDDQTITGLSILDLLRTGELDAKKFLEQVTPECRATEETTGHQRAGKQFPLIQELFLSLNTRLTKRA